MLDRRNLGDIFRAEPGDHPQFIDLRRPESPQTWTIAEMHATVLGVARGLGARGLRAGDRVAILAANRAEFVAAYLGIMRAGLVAVPVNHRLPRETAAFILRDADVSVAIADDERCALVPAGVAVVRMDGRGDDSFASLVGDIGGHQVFAPVNESPDDLAEILYTSGSTGRPKGVPLSHEGQLWALGKWFTGDDTGLAERTLIVAPLYHMNGLFNTTVALANGITIVSLPRFEARPFLEAVARYRCTRLSGIPTMFALIAREQDLLARLDLDSVRMVTIGSAPLTDALLERVQAIFPRAVVQNGYGTTEAGPSVFGPHPEGRERPPLALGVPFRDIGWRLTGGASANDGVLHLQTPALMRGYVHLDGVTAERVRDGWYDTGDVMRRDADGFFYFVGRADDMFVCGGENVYPLEVEKLLERHPAVGQAAVVAVPDEIKGEIPIAFVVLAPGGGHSVDEEELRAFTLREGPAYSHPRAIVFVSAIPVASTHKVDRAALRDQAVAAARTRRREVKA